MKKLVIIEKGGNVHFIPIGDISKAKGIARGVNTKNLRDETNSFG